MPKAHISGKPGGTASPDGHGTVAHSPHALLGCGNAHAGASATEPASGLSHALAGAGGSQGPQRGEPAHRRPQIHSNQRPAGAGDEAFRPEAGFPLPEDQRRAQAKHSAGPRGAPAQKRGEQAPSCPQMGMADRKSKQKNSVYLLWTFR